MSKKIIYNTGDTQENHIELVYLQAMKRVLEENYPDTNYSIEAYRDDSVCLQKIDGMWAVYTGYRGQKRGFRQYVSIADACFGFFDSICHDKNKLSQLKEVFHRYLGIVYDG